MLTLPNPTLRTLTALVATLVLAACATQGGGTADHRLHHPGPAAPSTEAGAPRPGGDTMTGAQSGSEMMGRGTMGGQSGGGATGAGADGQSNQRAMDMNAMCVTYRDMQNASIEQRRAMMDQQMKGMSPEMRQQHMEMMRQQCK